MFNKEKRYVTGGIDERVPLELQCLMWASIEARIFFADEKIDDEVLALHHEQEQPPILNVHYTNYRPEYEEILHEKIFVIDDGDHSTMLFAYEY